MQELQQWNFLPMSLENQLIPQQKLRRRDYSYMECSVSQREGIILLD